MKKQIINISDVITGDNDVRYLNHLKENTIFSNLIEFSENWLSGCFEGKYGFLTIKDARMDKRNKLTSIVKSKEELLNLTPLSIFNFPHEIMTWIGEYMNKNYILHDNYNFHKEKGVEPTYVVLPSDNIEDYINDELKHWNKNRNTDGVSKIDVEMLIKVLAYIDTLPNKDKLLKEYKRNIQKNNEFVLKEIATIYPSTEKPFVIKLYGNDDSSYAKVCATKEEAFKAYEDVLSIKDSSHIYKDIFSIGFFSAN